MGNQDDLYLIFTSDGYYFLLPLSFVVTVRDGKNEDALLVLNFSEILEENLVAVEKNYMIVLEENEEKFGILADNVLELYKIEQESIMELRKPVINDKNQYLGGAVSLQLGDDRILAYILKPGVLYNRYRDEL